MNILQLRYFITIAQLENVTKASDLLHVSQSSLSKNIKTLEDELGGDLFIRKNNNTVMLSPFGEFISNDINNLIDLLKGMGVKVVVSTEYLVQTRNSLGKAIYSASYFNEYQDIYAYALIMVLLVLIVGELPLLARR